MPHRIRRKLSLAVLVAAVAPAFAQDKAAEVDKIFHDEESVRRLIGRFPDPRLVRACYEAGPTGYDLARLSELDARTRDYLTLLYTGGGRGLTGRGDCLAAVFDPDLGIAKVHLTSRQTVQKPCPQRRRRPLGG